MKWDINIISDPHANNIRTKPCVDVDSLRKLQPVSQR